MSDEPEIQRVTVPAGALVPCPANGFKGVVSVARRCGAGCQYFHGFIEVQEFGNFAERYRVHCAHPIARRMTLIETD